MVIIWCGRDFIYLLSLFQFASHVYAISKSTGIESYSSQNHVTPLQFPRRISGLHMQDKWDGREVSI